jgi:predicted nucleic acid-binding Zn ribbon protein
VITITPPARWLCDALGMQTNDHQQDWRARAQEMRALGDQMHDQLAREEMLRLANKYERLADWVQERSRLSAR